MPVSPDMVEDLFARTYDLYADAEERLLGIVARQLAAGLEAPGWAQRKLAAIQPLRRVAQAVVDELDRAVTLEVFDVVAEAYNRGHRAAVAELGALPDDARRLVDELTPNAQAVDRLAHGAVELVTATHRGILRAVEDGYRDVVAPVTATPLLGIGTRRQATQNAMRHFADRGISGFTDRAGRRWQLTSYAEMAVRTSTARAAIESHTRTLTEAGMDYVLASDAPRECPLCRPWEGRLLSIGGPDGRRMVELEHATRDGEMLRVVVQGSLDEARLAGFQHPNCRHSVSAYIPGVTSLVPPMRSDGSGYEAGQRQRAIERNIRKHKKRSAAAVTPEAKRAADAKVRRWQGAMRDHLAEHPNLRRNRERERLGAGNLPPQRREAPAEAVEVARLRAGDEHTPAEMSEQQLADAVGSGLGDARDLDRAAEVLDRRDEQQLLDRVRPGGKLVDDLTPYSDNELARALPHLFDDQVLTVAAELDRRDVAAGLPGVRADLVALSEDGLAARVRRATDEAEFAALAAEADRRQLLAELFPAGQLAPELSPFGDEVLGWAVLYARGREAEQIAAEIDRRYPVDMPELPATGDAVADQLSDRRHLDETLAPVPAPDEWGWIAGDEPEPDRFAGMSPTERWVAEREEDQRAAQGAYTRAQIREMYREHTYRQWLAAEDWCRGYLLNRHAAAEGIDPESLFSGPAHVAYARASEELKRYWAEHPRLTLAEFTEQLTGQSTVEAERSRQARSEQDNRQ
ncbi:minor capsid protein 2 [Streptomyces sp. Amel2xB2]|uniref:phage minor capsid protein n=1 Tax=Streptomyces sp. Amel2xB2 TaxID=1305829 RepID=UPI000DBF7553|nr:phage minor capsid protein [Streptomyces sp. Amel2xB2]RAJ61691.1 minor capsid protein 2 [Streptomyces sp. Amel2xB2]